MNVTLMLAKTFGVLACLFGGNIGLILVWEPGKDERMLWLVGALLLPTLIFLVVAAFPLSARTKRLTLLAATPLPPPPAAPLAPYRDGPPAECPRHPFAR
jgi:hypothetical protein